jgi:hypothetical protein
MSKKAANSSILARRKAFNHFVVNIIVNLIFLEWKWSNVEDKRCDDDKNKENVQELHLERGDQEMLIGLAFEWKKNTRMRDGEGW